MKRIITTITCLILICSLVGCGKNISNSTTTNDPSTQEHSTNIPSTDSNPTTTEPKEDGQYMNKTIEKKMAIL